MALPKGEWPEERKEKLEYCPMNMKDMDWSGAEPMVSGVSSWSDRIPPSVNEKQGPAACQVTGGECKDALTSIGRPVCVFVIFLIQELEQNKDSQKQGCRCR